ncbi:metallophosphoesterase family protein [Dokdonella sp. MW10]|uniref:metallophosphoesterase family protein n=1 Tax=Dokdonella sp. MW10 TaxID=2992926 RepID=UPI003F7D6376
MGFQFYSRHTNLVAYATTIAAEAPRVDAEQLWEFLGAISHARHTGWLISRDPDWPEYMSRAACDAMERVERAGIRRRLASSEEVEESLRDIRAELTGYRLYALVTAGWEAFSARDFALESGGDALVLLPVGDYGHESPNVVDMLPPAAVLQQARGAGVLLWTPDGDARFVSEMDFSSKFRASLLEAIQRGDRNALHELLRRQGDERGATILHLSDLHFGRKDAAANLGMLQTQLTRIGRDVDRIAITGDLLDNPRASDLVQFQAFRTTLRAMVKEQLVVVPGNHDMRYLGNIGRTFEQVAQVPVTRVTVDGRMRVIFIGVNSALEGDFAKGRVTQQQLTELGAELNAEFAARPEVESYLRVVLVHHHPFPYTKAPEAKGLVSRILGRREEGFLRLEDAKEFLEWCARLRISVVLHGHKHMARYLTKGIELRNRRPVPVTAVGCGSSLGAENSAISYNILRWNASGSRWDAQFFESVGGALFEPRLIGCAREVTS